MFWVPKNQVNQKLLRKYLRVTGNDYVADKIVDCWETDNDMIGLPRYWAFEHGLKGQDHTVCPESVWEPFRGSYRPGQQECVQAALKRLRKHSSCLIEAFTGFGKTIVSTAIASELNTPTLVLVHKEDFLLQWAHDTARDVFGIEAGIVRGGDTSKWTWKQPMVVAMMQTLAPNLGSLPKGFTEQFGFVIVDEGHHFPCASMQSILKAFPAKYRMGVSATWDRTDGLNKIWNLHFGPVNPRVIQKKASFKRMTYEMPLINPGFHDKNCYAHGKVHHSKYQTAVGESHEIAHQLAIKATIAYEQGRNILMVSHRTRQLELFKIELDARGVPSVMYTGKHTTTKKEAEQHRVILATASKVAEGTNIPKLDTLICGTPFGKITQVAGRITREYKDKQDPHIVYAVSNTPYGKAIHHKVRKQLTKLGFTNNSSILEN